MGGHKLSMRRLDILGQVYKMVVQVVVVVEAVEEVVVEEEQELLV
jgi:hypothetical protein